MVRPQVGVHNRSGISFQHARFTGEHINIYSGEIILVNCVFIKEGTLGFNSEDKCRGILHFTRCLAIATVDFDF